MREVWITDAGVVTAAGNSLEETWHAILSGKKAIREITRFPVGAYRAGIGASIPNIEPSGKESLVHAVTDILLESLGELPAESLLITATTKAGIDNLEKMKRGHDFDPRDILPSSLGESITTRLGLKRGFLNISAACASATVAVARGAALIASEQVESVFICSVEVLTEFVFSGFSALQIMSPFPCKPFDRDRAGLTLGEGAAFLTLMNPERARRLGHPPKGIVAGAGIASDAFHITAPDREAAGLIRAISAAILSAGIERGAIAGISAHGTGTISNDMMELTAFHRIFGENVPPGYSVKGSIGHTFGAAGGIEIALGTKALTEQTLLPTVGLINPEKGAEGLVRAEPLSMSGDYLLATNSGFGGVNGAVILKRALPS